MFRSIFDHIIIFLLPDNTEALLSVSQTSCSSEENILELLNLAVAF
jgi:hypothetical protein